jgi:predicted dehydrogenase
MRFGLLGNDPDGVAMACALVESGRYQIAAATAPVGEEVIQRWNTDFRRSIDIEEVLADPSIALVVVAGPLFTRGLQLRRAVQSERHVLCVYPPDRTSEIAYEAGMMQQDTGFVLMPLLPLVLHPALLRLGELLRDGAAVRPPTLIEVEAGAREELTIRFEEGAVRPNFPGWEVLRLLGGEIDEVSGFAEGDEVKPGAPVLLAGRFVRGGLFQLTLLPRQPEGSWRLTAFGHAGRAELYLPQGWQGPTFLNYPGQDGQEREESWEAWDPWPALIAAFEAVAKVYPGRAVPPREQQAITPRTPARVESSPPTGPTWQDAVRGLELDDAAQRSIEKRRSSPLEYRVGGEEASFKGMMTLVGCSLVWGILLLLILSAWVPAARWLIAPLLIVFLTLQLLRYIIPQRPGPDRPSPEARDVRRGEPGA